MDNIEVKFKQWDCVVVKHTYVDNNRTALELYDKKTGEPVTMATVNVPDFPLKPNQTIVKNYGANEGLLEVLIENKIVSEPEAHIKVGYVKNVPICKLLI